MKKYILILLTAGILFSCNETESDPQPDPIPEVMEMTIDIDHRINDSAIDWINTTYTLGAGTKVNITRLAYILSNFYLIKVNGDSVHLDDQYALIDPKRGLWSVKLTDIPMANYSGYGFSLGLNSDVNHADPNQWDVNHPLSPVNNALHWNWTAGYIFIAVEGRIADNGGSYVFHLAGDRNRVDYNFPLNFEKKEAALNAQMRFDYEEIFENPNLFDMETDGKSAHTEDGPVATALIQNLAKAFTVESVE